MKRIIFLISIALFAGLPSIVFGGQTIIGGGSMECEAYAESDEVIKLATESWTLGFLSSANMRSKNMDLLLSINSVAVIAAVESFCATHPSDNIAKAAIHVLMELVASAEGDCSLPRSGPAHRYGLNHCDNPASIENSNEPTGWSMTVPAVE